MNCGADCVGQVNENRWILACLIVLLLSPPSGRLGHAESATPWAVLFEDKFARDQLSSDWVDLFSSSGPGLAVQDNSLTFTKDANFYCRQPLPAGNVRVEFDLLLPAGEVMFLLRSGEAVFSGGGRYEAYAIRLVALQGTNEVAAPTAVAVTTGLGVDLSKIPAAFPVERESDCTVAVPRNRQLRVALQILDGQGSVEIDGATFARQRVPPARSEFNRYFAGRSFEVPFAQYADTEAGRYGGRIGNFRMLAPPGSTQTIELHRNSPAENRRATAEIQSAPADDGGQVFQDAINSLPPSGGVVLLPAGVFTVRRHLSIPSNVSLRGRGAGRTVLRLAPVIEAEILKMEPGQTESLVTVKDKAAIAGLRVGDGVTFDSAWGYPLLTHVRLDNWVAAVNGDQIRVRHGGERNLRMPTPIGTRVTSGGLPNKLQTFHPMLLAQMAEFAEVSDITVLDDAKHKVGLDGGADLNPVYFNVVAAGRITRMRIGPWSADGISCQTGNDVMVVDNTCTETATGLHPGGGQERAIFARNLSINNRVGGFYFCYNNRNGIYVNQTLDSITGYAWPWDLFDLIAFNECAKKTAIEGYWWGVIYGNRFPEFSIGWVPHEKNPVKVYLGSFVVADNRVTALTKGCTDDSEIDQMMLANNAPVDGVTEIAPLEFKNSLFLAKTDLPGPPADLKAGCGRSSPVPPPALPEPVLDGRSFYDPASPDAGFQKALDSLAKTGGTLRLPGGRYALKRPLRPPAGVTIAGYGVATVLCAAPGVRDQSLIVAENVDRVTVRELSVLGEYGLRAERPPAIVFRQAQSAACVAVDLRGWEGDGLWADGSEIDVSDSRAFGCAGAGFRIENSKFALRTGIARDCTVGFSIRRAVKGSSLYALIAGLNWQEGYLVRESDGLTVTSCNASMNGRDGFQFESCRNVIMLGSVVMQNSQSESGTFAGIRLGTNCHDNVVGYSLVADIQGAPTQRVAIREEASGGGNTIRCNIATDKIRHDRFLNKQPDSTPAAIVSEGEKSVVGDNLTR